MTFPSSVLMLLLACIVQKLISLSDTCNVVALFATDLNNILTKCVELLPGVDDIF